MTNIDEVRQAVRERRLETLLGMEESNWLDVKGGIYALDTPKAAEELVKDVAGFANTRTGGLLLVGFKTQIEHGVEIVSELAPVPRALVDLDRHRKLIDQRVIPTVRGLEIVWVDCGDEKGVLLIDIPAQPQISLPFVVPGPNGSGTPSESTVAVPMRRGDRTPWLPKAEIQRLLAAGWAVAGGPAAESPASNAADRAKTGQVLEAIPRDARWIKTLAQGAPMHRVPTWLGDAIYDAHEALTRDVVVFIDAEVTEAHQALTEALGDLCNQISGTFPPAGGGDGYTEVPPEWKGTDHTRYYKALADLSAARQGVLDRYQELMNTMNRKGLLI
ncbi:MULTISPECIES: hypothetical protein [unclassified Kitasatospora]|uniref:AlbA family DNA-binding domain-containing protein n=1 Tax=unclassified Kitasatospora TaxID=2633591 RepID=UPI0034001502